MNANGRGMPRGFRAGLIAGLATWLALFANLPARAQLLDELDKIAEDSARPEDGKQPVNNAEAPQVPDASSCALRGFFVLETIPFGGTEFEREYGTNLYWHPNGEVSVPALSLGPGVVGIGLAIPGFEGDWLYSASSYPKPRRKLYELRALKCNGTSLEYDELAATNDPELMLESDEPEREFLQKNPIRLKSALAGNGDTLSGEIGWFHLHRSDDGKTVKGHTAMSRPWRMRRVETSARLTVEDGSGKAISGSGAMKLAHGTPFRLHVDETIGVSAIAAFWPAGRPVLAESGRISLDRREGGLSSGPLRLIDNQRAYTRRDEADDPESLDFRSYTDIPLAQGESIEISIDGRTVVTLTAYTLPDLLDLKAVDEAGRELASVAPGHPFRLEARYEFDHPEEWVSFGIEGGGLVAGIDAGLGEGGQSPVEVERRRQGPRLFRSDDASVFRSEPLAIMLQAPADDPLSFARIQPGYDAARAAQTAASLFPGEWIVEHQGAEGALKGTAVVASDGVSATLTIAGAAGERRYRSVEIDAAAFPATDPTKEIRQLVIRFDGEPTGEEGAATSAALPIAVAQGSERLAFVMDDLTTGLDIDATATDGRDRIRVFLLAKASRLEGSWSEELNGNIIERGAAAWKRSCGPSSLAAFEPIEGSGVCYFVGPDVATWTEGQSFCEGHGGHLAVISSAEENALVAELMNRCQNQYGCWIGADDNASEGKFVWVDGTPVSFSNWNSGQPDNYCSGEHFVHMMRDGRWNDQAVDGGCSGWGLMNPICEVAAPEREPVNPVPVPPEGQPTLRFIGLGDGGLTTLSELTAGEPFMIEARFADRREEASFTIALETADGASRDVSIAQTDDANVYRSAIIRLGAN